MHHSEFIETLAAIYKPNYYLELGLYQGETIQKVAKHVQTLAVGVDTQPLSINDTKIVIHQCTTDDFFNIPLHQNIEFDMIFIDADHRFESVQEDFRNSLYHLRHDGIIILHDTDPESDHLFNTGYCGDCYKIVPFIERIYPGLNIVTLPIAEAGLSIVTRKNSTRTQRRKHEERLAATR